MKLEHNANNNIKNEREWQEKDIAHAIFKNYHYENHPLHIAPSIDSLLKQIVDTNYKLFYKIPHPFCDDCIKPMLTDLQYFQKRIEANKIILITSFPTQEEVNFFKKNMKIDNLHLINLPENDLTLDTKEMIGAYTFLLNNDLQAICIFFCSKFNSFYNNDYLKAIEKYLLL